MWEGQTRASMALHSPQKGCRARVRTLEDTVTELLFSKCSLLLTAFYFTFLFHLCINLIILNFLGRRACGSQSSMSSTPPGSPAGVE